MLLTYYAKNAIIIKNSKEYNMPVISRFDGMVVKMYFIASEHNPPHIHVIHGDYIGVIDIQTA